MQNEGGREIRVYSEIWAHKRTSRADSPHNRAGDTTGEQAGRRRGIAPDSEANGDKVAAQGAPSLAQGMVILEVPKVNQVRRISNQGGLGEQSRNQHGRQTQRQDNRMDKR